MRAFLCDKMQWTYQEFESQPTDFLIDLLYLYRTRNIIGKIEQNAVENLIQSMTKGHSQ